MKRKNLLTLTIIIFGVLLLPLISPTQVQAVSKNKKAMKAYETFLSGGNIRWGRSTVYKCDLKFAVKDLNKDGVKELLLYNTTACHADGWERIYCYSSGRVKSCGNFSSIDFYPNKKYILDCYSNGGTAIYKYYRIKKNGKKTLLASYTFSYVNPYNAGNVVKKYDPAIGGYCYYSFFKVNEKKTSYSKCMAVIKKLENGAKRTQINYQENDEWNRGVYLK